MAQVASLVRVTGVPALTVSEQQRVLRTSSAEPSLEFGAPSRLSKLYGRNLGNKSFHGVKLLRDNEQASSRVHAQASSAPPSPGVREASSPQDIEALVPGLRHTVWDQQDARPSFPKLEENMSADVVVVGGGIAGLSVAYNLVQAGKKVVVLEAKCIGSGQTGKTTAHLMPWNDDYYSMLESMHGQQKAALVGNSHKAAIDFVERTVKNENIDCEFERVDGYLFPHVNEQSVMDMLLKEYEASRRCGWDEVALVDLGSDPSLGSLNTVIKFPGAADFHPLKYVRGLADAIVSKGGHVFELTRVMNQEGTTVETADGRKVSASAVVLATNSPINHNLTVHARQMADRSYVVGLKVPKGAIKRAQWWDTDTPYHYVRIEPKEDFDVLVVGGNDHSAGSMSPDQYPDAWGMLEKWARERWTPAGEVVYRWTGQVYKPIDSLHLYHHDPLNLSNTWVVTGDSGQGMTGSTIAGMLISDLILEKPNPWADVYNTHRFPPLDPMLGSAVGTQALHTVEGYAMNLPLLGTDTLQESQIKNCSGATIDSSKGKMAVYKDETGTAREFSAVCPHLGCVVRWNPNDSTFDCPCHGSQFDTRGRVIQGPAKADLANLSDEAN